MGKLNDSQLRQLGEFMSNLGIVFIAVVVTPMFSKFDSINLLGVVLGLVAAMICMGGSMLLLKDKKP